MHKAAGFEVAALPADEAQRLRALEGLRVMDTPPEPVLDDIAWLAAQICATPTALVSLVDTDRQWFKARCGLEVSETPRDFAFCAHAILTPDVLEVPDALQDPRFAGNPLVVGFPGIRFYAGAPLKGKDGLRYGSLCVLDYTPRKLTDLQCDALVRLARQAVSHLESRTERLQAQTRQQTLARLLEAMPDGVVSCDEDGLLAEFNGAARQWHGIDPRALPPEQWASHFGLFEADGLQPLSMERIPLLRAWRGESVRGSEIVIKAEQQPARTVLCNAERLLSPQGDALGAVCIMHDVSDVKESEARLRTISANVPTLIAHVGPDLRCLFVNEAFTAFFVEHADTFIAEHMSRILGDDLYSRIAGNLDSASAGGRMSFDCMHAGASGDVRHLHVTCIPDLAHAPEGAAGTGSRGFYLMAHDITEHKEHAQVLEQRAMRDELTGLANRAGWSQQFKRGLKDARRRGTSVAVMFLDLDEFKQVNDTYGHEAGDAVLKEFATRLRSTVRTSDVVARLSGDEFVVFLGLDGDPDQSPEIVARKVLAAVELPLEFQGHLLPIKPSIGIALQRGPHFDASTLMRLADEAMYAAKRSPADRFIILKD